MLLRCLYKSMVNRQGAYSGGFFSWNGKVGKWQRSRLRAMGRQGGLLLMKAQLKRTILLRSFLYCRMAEEMWREGKRKGIGYVKPMPRSGGSGCYGSVLRYLSMPCFSEFQ